MTTLNRNTLLDLWFYKQPSVTAPTEMWETLKEGELTLFTSKYNPPEGKGGVQYQWQCNGKWVGNREAVSFDYFERYGPNKPSIDKGDDFGLPSIGPVD